ncbi:hypothetical protein Tco_1159014 [Tanacetum coccineum]
MVRYQTGISSGTVPVYPFHAWEKNATTNSVRVRYQSGTVLLPMMKSLRFLPEEHHLEFCTGVAPFERECFDNSSMALIPAAGVTLGIVLKQESGWYLLRKAFLGGPSLSYTSGDSKSVPNRSGRLQVEFFKGWKPLSPLQLAVEEVMSE